MSEFVKVILIILLSSVKFAAGPPFAYFDQRYDFTFFETVIYCLIGGMLGVWVFTFFSLEIQVVINWIKRKFKHTIAYHPFQSSDSRSKAVQTAKDQASGEGLKKKIFSKKSRRFVKLWRKYGLIGVSFLTPVIISIPVGTIILNLFEENKKKIFIYMFFSILFWAVTLTSIFEIMHVVNIPQLKEKIFG